MTQCTYCKKINRTKRAKKLSTKNEVPQLTLSSPTSRCKSTGELKSQKQRLRPQTCDSPGDYLLNITANILTFIHLNRNNS